MGPGGIILVNPPITTLQQNLTHSAVITLRIAHPNYSFFYASFVLYLGPG